MKNIFLKLIFSAILIFLPAFAAGSLAAAGPGLLTAFIPGPATASIAARDIFKGPACFFARAAAGAKSRGAEIDQKMLARWLAQYLKLSVSNRVESVMRILRDS